VGDIDTVVVDSLKALDLKRPIREADIVEPPVSAISRHSALYLTTSSARASTPEKLT
jgi:hypothetical protein